MTILLDASNTPVWRIYKYKNGAVKPVLVGWYSNYSEEDFLTTQTFGTEVDARTWLKEFWRTYWNLVA